SMADTLAGGWVRSALRSPVRMRPQASESSACSDGRGAACASTRSSASATDGNATSLLLCAEMAAAAAALLDEPDAFDAHAAVDRLHHVVDGEAGDGHGGERLHLDAGLARDLDAGGDFEARQTGIRPDIDLGLGNGKRVAQWNEVMGALGGH